MDGTCFALELIMLSNKSYLMEGGEEMKKFAIALAIVLGLVGSILNLSAPVSYAQEEPAPKPDKPGD
jgi:hypothetical protein